MSNFVKCCKAIDVTERAFNLSPFLYGLERIHDITFVKKVLTKCGSDKAYGSIFSPLRIMKMACPGPKDLIAITSFNALRDFHGYKYVKDLNMELINTVVKTYPGFDTLKIYITMAEARIDLCFTVSKIKLLCEIVLNSVPGTYSDQRLQDEFGAYIAYDFIKIRNTLLYIRRILNNREL